MPRAPETECSLSDVDVLNEVHCTPGQRLRMLDLAERLGVTRGGLTRIVDRLVARGWLIRERPAQNRREVFALITDEGRRVLRDARVVYIRVLTETLGAYLDDPALDELAISMTTVRDGLSGSR